VFSFFFKLGVSCILSVYCGLRPSVLFNIHYLKKKRKKRLMQERKAEDSKREGHILKLLTKAKTWFKKKRIKKKNLKKVHKLLRV